MKTMELGGKWVMRQLPDGAFLDSEVPGSACGTLLSHGLIPDPYYRDNEQRIRDVFEKDYEFSRTFIVPPELLDAPHIELCCEGLDTIATLELNGVCVGKADNMHCTWRFDVRHALRCGENILRITFRSPVKYIEEHPSPIGKRYTTIRKAACMFGWDWGIDLPDCGIWRPIRLEWYDGGRLAGNILRQTHEPDQATLYITPLCDGAGEKASVLLTLRDPDGAVIAEQRTPPNAETAIAIRSPQLWWPRGYGGQPLYTLETALIEDGRVCDIREQRVGLRTLVLDRSSCDGGAKYAFVANGIPVFFRGENLVIPDALLGRVNWRTWERMAEDAVLSNLNGIRVWGGAIYPPDEFFDLCDQNGIMVYLDMMFACSFYMASEDFLKNVRQELNDNLSRIAHHPCLALICGNNEIDGIYTVGGSTEPETVALRKLFGAGPDPLPESTRAFLWSQYKPLFLELIPEQCRRWAPDVSYVHSSPSSREPGQAKSFFDYLPDGDMHYYLQYNGYAPYEKMRTYRTRFMSEIGFQSYPGMKTVCQFTQPEDRRPYTPVMYVHQKCAGGNEAIELYMQRDYLVPQDFSDYILLSQIQAGEIMRYTIEHFRRDNRYCRGLAIWQFNDCWPVVSWSGIDYFGRWKALQYYLKRCYSPVLISAEDVDTSVRLWLTNETTCRVFGVLCWKLMCGSDVLDQGSLSVTVAPGESESKMDLDYSSLIDGHGRDRTYLRYSFKWNDGVQRGTVLFTKAKNFQFEKPELCITATGNELRLSSNVFARSIALDTTGCDCVFSDNFFDLAPGEVQTIRAVRGTLKLEELTVRTLNDILLLAGGAS